MLAQRGEVPSKLYFILYGRASVLCADLREVNWLAAGDFCGEELFHSKPSPMLIKACDLLYYVFTGEEEGEWSEGRGEERGSDQGV